MFILKIKNDNKINLYDLEKDKSFILNMKRLEDMNENEKPSILSNTMFKTMFYHTKRLKYSVNLII